MTPRRMSSGSPEGLTYSFPELDVDALLREMVLYIAKRSADDPRFGATKLNKLLWWADFLSYGMRGKPITGTAYMRLPQGQVPRRLVPVRAQLIAADHLFIESRPYYGLEQYRPVAKRDADLSAFSGEDVALVDRIIEAFWNVSASAMGDISHGHAWKSAEDGEDVPYEMIFLSDESPTEEDILRARELADRYGWDE